MPSAPQPAISPVIPDNDPVHRRLRMAVVIFTIAATAAAVQFDAPGRPHRSDVGYDGQFTFVRLRWKSDLSSSSSRGAAAASAPPGITTIRARSRTSRASSRSSPAFTSAPDGSLILTLDDPELFNYPIAFMWEPGFWNLTDREAASFRAYLLKGGFAVFEDFDGGQQWNIFEAQMRRVLPDARFVKLDKTHRIFDSFFKVKDIDAIVHPMSGIRPSYYGIFEDNDPSKRLMVVANFDNDVPEYWEWSGQGLFPFDASNEAYKLGVNYVIYGLTH